MVPMWSPRSFVRSVEGVTVRSGSDSGECRAPTGIGGDLLGAQGSADLGVGRAHPGGNLTEALQVEAEELGGVPAQHLLDLSRIDAGEREPKRLGAERITGLSVRVVAAPHDGV